MNYHIDASRIGLHVNVEHIDHTITIDIGKVEQVVDLLGNLFARDEAERTETLQGALALSFSSCCGRIAS